MGWADRSSPVFISPEPTSLLGCRSITTLATGPGKISKTLEFLLKLDIESASW